MKPRRIFLLVAVSAVALFSLGCDPYGNLTNLKDYKYYVTVERLVPVEDNAAVSFLAQDVRRETTDGEDVVTLACPCYIAEESINSPGTGGIALLRADELTFVLLPGADYRVSILQKKDES